MHTIRDKTKLTNRVKRIQGQLEGVTRQLLEEKEPDVILQSIASCRGAINGLMLEVMKGHIELHIMDASLPEVERAEGMRELVAVLETYLK